jgi:hypothetical protein
MQNRLIFLRSHNLPRIKERVESVKLTFDTFARVVDKQEKLIHRLFKAARHRGQQYKHLLDSTAKLTSTCFTSFLESRNYTGEAIFDHQEGTLSLEVRLSFVYSNLYYFLSRLHHVVMKFIKILVRYQVVNGRFQQFVLCLLFGK